MFAQEGDPLSHQLGVGSATDASPNALLLTFVQTESSHPYWIQMNIPAEGQRPLFWVDQHGLEPPLQQVTAATVPPVEPDTVADVEPLHRSAQVCFGQLQQ